MSNNLFDIYNYNIFKFNVDIKYQYNQYNPFDEDIDYEQQLNFDFKIDLKDTSFDITNSITSGYSSNKITINMPIRITDYLSDKTLKNLNSNILNVSSNDLIQKIKAFENINLNLDSIKYFNDRLTYEDKVVSLYSKPSKKYIQKTIESYKLNVNNFNEILNTKEDENFKNSLVSNKYFKNIMINKKVNQYSTDDNLFKYYSTGNNNKSELILSEYVDDVYHFENHIDNIINFQDENVTDEFDKKLIFEKFEYFSITPYSNRQPLYTFAFPVGFLIKKNIKRKDTNEILRNVSSQFVFFDISNPVKSIVKYDNNISYSNYYSYDIQLVFCLSIVNNGENGEPFIYHYLICQNSYTDTWKRAIDYYQPEPPNALRAKYIYGSKKVLLQWDNPVNPQNDIIGYHIYRRTKLNEPYELIKVYVKKSFEKYKNFTLHADIFDTNDTNLVKILNSNSLLNEFIDDVDNINNLYIYTVCAFDAHGMVSNYSNQIAIRYSQIYNQLIVDNISLANAPRQYPNIYIRRKSILFNNDNLLFNFAPFFKNKKYLKMYFTPDTNQIKSMGNNGNNIINLNFNNVDYHLNILRLTDLKSKNIKFNLK